MGVDLDERARTNWRLVLSTVAFALWAPPSFVGLPLAALMLAARPRGAAQWGAAVLVGVPSVALLLLMARGDIVSAAAHAYIVLVAATFVLLTLVAPMRFLPQALRASVIALGAALVLARVILGPEAGDMLQWQATRQASETLRPLIALRPEAYVVLDPAVRFLGETVPALLVLQSLAGLGLAWQWHQLLAARPLGTPLAPFRDFRFADGWVWAIVGAVTIWITPLLAGLKAAALNLLVVVGTLYLLRGAAIVVAFAVMVGVSPASLMVGLLAAAVLAVPLLFVVPGLATLGMTDTWLEFRRRLAGRPNAS
jgi:hypothetical protein